MPQLCVCVLLSLAQAGARPEPRSSDPFALSQYMGHSRRLEEYFRKCLIRQTFDAMKRRDRAEDDLENSIDTPGCKVRVVRRLFVLM